MMQWFMIVAPAYFWWWVYNRYMTILVLYVACLGWLCVCMYMCEILATTKQKWWKWKGIRAKTKYWVLGMFEHWLSVLVIFILVRIKRQVIGERVEGGRQRAGSVGGRIDGQKWYGVSVADIPYCNQLMILLLMEMFDIE